MRAMLTRGRSLTVVATLLTTMLVPAQPAAAAVYPVRYTGGDGVALRWNANNDKMQPLRVIPEGTHVDVLCQAWSASVAGPRNNHIYDFIRHGDTLGWVPDAYMGTPAPANQYSAGIPRCEPGTSHIEQGRVWGVAVNGVHPWGSCQVQDFNKDIPNTGPWGWFIKANGHVVRQGMLGGWFDNGGAPGTLRCPTSPEYAHGNGARQNFQGGVLEWLPGMGNARIVRGTPAPTPTPTPAPTQPSQPSAQYPGWDAVCASKTNSKGGCYDADFKKDGTLNSPRGYAWRNCTDYVAWRAQLAGRAVPTDWSHARNWDDRAGSHRVHSTPQVGDIAQKDGGYGHVAWVVGIDSAAGVVVVDEYNWSVPKGSSYYDGKLHAGVRYPISRFRYIRLG